MVWGDVWSRDVPLSLQLFGFHRLDKGDSACKFIISMILGIAVLRMPKPLPTLMFVRIKRGMVSHMIRILFYVQ